MPPARAAAFRAFAVRRVDVHAADDLASGDAKHGVGKSTALGEVLRVAFEVAQIVRQAHLARPVRRPSESRRCVDVLDAGCPGGIVRGIVPRRERFKPELLGGEPVGYREVHRNEQLLSHQAMLTGRPPNPPDGTEQPRLTSDGRDGGDVLARPLQGRTLGLDTTGVRASPERELPVRRGDLSGLDQTRPRNRAERGCRGVVVAVVIDFRPEAPSAVDDRPDEPQDRLSNLGVADREIDKRRTVRLVTDGDERLSA